jgi:hypothetical protein
VEQWLEARRVRGFADGGPTSNSGAQLPVAAANPSTDGEKLYAVMSQLLEATKSMDGRLAGVETWQRELRVNLNLRNTRAGLSELETLQQNSAIRSKR